MNLGTLGRETQTKLIGTLDGVKRFAKFEQYLAALCFGAPILLIGFDNWSIRDSISAYYNMGTNQLYYYPLTLVAVLFMINGLIRNQHYYNTALGVALSGVILFNHIEARIIHIVFAALFFGGNAFVVLRWSSVTAKWFKALVVIVIAATMGSHFLLNWISLFWAEWISFTMIAIHYILESRYGEIEVIHIEAKA